MMKVFFKVTFLQTLKKAKINHVFLMASSQYPNLTTKTAEHLERYRKGKVANDNIPEANV